MANEIQDGDRSSASGFMQALSGMRTLGQSVLDDLAAARAETLFRVEQSLSAINSKRQLGSRVLAPDVACRFIVSDLLDIDQALSSATLRIDAQSATCRENSSSAAAQIRRLTFNSAVGTVEQFGSLYRVHVLDDSRPTGVFEIEFYDAHAVTMLVFDMVSMPSNPTIEVFGSADGVTLTRAKEVSVNGYRVNAWFSSQEIRYVQIQISPRMPDTLGGSSYTFGLTSLTALATRYYLYSEVVSKPVAFRPLSSKVRFRAEDAGLRYFLQFDGGTIFKVEPDEVVSLPVVQDFAVQAHINPQWRFSTTEPPDTPYLLPATVYPSTLKVVDKDLNRSVRIAYGLNPAQAGQVLTHEYVGVHQGGLYLLPVNDNLYVEQSGRLFEARFAAGPDVVTASLRVQLSTSDRDQTPVFRGAWLEHMS